MKKNLRLLCLGLAALTFNAGFAQAENVTSKLRNANLEEGIRGWGVEGTSQIFGKVSKSHATKNGYHGVDGQAVEMWIWAPHGTLADGYITQNVKNLPNGTYVFGAYAAASLQGTQESNKEDITGITLFANENVVPVATDDPDKNDVKWAHTAKFNVAATVAEGGDLHVGLKVEQTNANFTLIDNATLYYFPGMSEAEALNEMAKIDIAATIAIADTCFAHHMQVDTLALLNDAKAAAQTLTTADQLWQLNEDLYWAISRATKSISDYRSFNKAIAHAEDMANTEWSAEQTPGVVDALNALIVSAKATYEAATAGRPELNEQKAALNEAAALVALDSCYVRMENLQTVVDELEVGEEIGEYSEEMIDRMEYLLWEVNAALDAAANMEMSALAAQNVCDSLFTAWQFAYDNPITVDAFPFTITTSQEANADNRYEYTSKTYAFAYPVTNLRFTFLDTFCPNGSGKGDPVFVALGEFYLYDADGELIELGAENFSTNAQESSEGPIANICDGDINTHFHSDWHGNVKVNHYIEITLPEGLNLTSFSFGWIDRGNRQNIPLVVEVSSITTASADLESAISSAKLMKPYTGTEPGFYKEDVSAFYTALAAAEALVGTDATDDVVYAAIGALEEAQTMIDEYQVIMPEAGKKYRIVSSGAFYANQGISKALTSRNDTLWWETAGKDSLNQEFVLQPIANADGRAFYTVQNVATKLYLNSPEEGDYHGFFATPDTVELIAIGAGQFGLKATSAGVFHACDHNSGRTGAGWTGDVYGQAGGLFGEYSRIIPYGEADLNGFSSWYFREMNELPYDAANIAEANFTSAPIHLYTGVNTITLTANATCSFADLVVYDVLGNVIPSTYTTSGATATVLLDTANVETFSFAFTAEGVTSVKVEGSISKLSELQTALDAALAVAPKPGLAVMEYADLKDYNAAIDAANDLLLNGGSDEEINKAIKALEDAVAALKPNMPEADKAYYIVNAVAAFEENHGVPMMLYANVTTGQPRWMYENTNNPNRLWQFELAPVADDAEEGAPAMYYIKNVATGTYFGDGVDALVAKDAAAPYAITSLGESQVALDKNAESSGRIHANGHGGGAGKGNNIVYWSSGFGTASAWYIYESEAYLTDIDFTEIEEGADEYVAPAVKGIFDLFGRRLEAPAAAGIYIIDGKKKVVK